MQSQQGLSSATVQAFGEDRLDREGHEKLFAFSHASLEGIAELVVWVKALATKLEGLSLSFRT